MSASRSEQGSQMIPINSIGKGSHVKQRFAVWIGITCLLCTFTGCLTKVGEPVSEVLVYSRKGFDPGRLIKPRAITIDPVTDEIYVADMTGRIQAFSREGEYLRGWRTPDCRQGRPVGISFSHDGLVIVCDTHYYQVLFYRPNGELVEERTIGGKNGRGPGEFGFITDAAQDSKGNYYIGEYGDYDRIQKFDPQGKYLTEFGSHGTEPEEFLRPQCLTIDRDDQLWVADISNHRVQVFDVSRTEPKLVRVWGSQGAAPGEFSYPNSIWVDDERDQVLVCDMGNHRIQVFTKLGEYLGSWGGPGRLPGEMYQPWAHVRDSHGSVHVIDTYNHRVQRFDAIINKSTN